MVTQTFIDFLCGSIAYYLNLLPQLPVGLSVAFIAMQHAAGVLGAGLTNLGPIIPFDIVNNCLLGVSALILYWSAMVSLRLLMWLVNR